MEIHKIGVAISEPTAGGRPMDRLHIVATTNYIILSSPCTNIVALLEGTISPEVESIIHWMVVPLYSTGIWMKYMMLFSASILSVWSRSSSCVPFTNHWNCSAVADVDMHVKVVFPPGTTTLSG